MTNIPISTPPPDIAAAGRGLAAVLANDPRYEDRLAAAEALSILADVIPPYPPLEYPAGTYVNVDAAIGEVLNHLVAAIDAGLTVEEATRCGHAARVLRERWRTGGQQP